MCLSLIPTIPHLARDRSSRKVVYKLVYQFEDGTLHNYYTGGTVGYHTYILGKEMVSNRFVMLKRNGELVANNSHNLTIVERANDEVEFGFHVVLTKEDALRLLRGSYGSSLRRMIIADFNIDIDRVGDINPDTVKAVIVQCSVKKEDHIADGIFAGVDSAVYDKIVFDKVVFSIDSKGVEKDFAI